MSKPEKITETVSIECASANVVMMVERWQYPVSPKDLSALDCKSDPRNFERLLHYFIEAFAKSHAITPAKLCELVPDQEMRAALHKALKYFNASRGYKFSTYASWWFRQALMPYLPRRPLPLVICGCVSPAKNDGIRRGTTSPSRV